MPRVTFVLGLCGSRKSTRAKELVSHGFTNFDEEAVGLSVRPDWPGSAWTTLEQAVTNGENCVVTDIAFYLGALRDLATHHLQSLSSDLIIEWECFSPTEREIADYNCANDPGRPADRNWGEPRAESFHDSSTQRRYVLASREAHAPADPSATLSSTVLPN